MKSAAVVLLLTIIASFFKGRECIVQDSSLCEPIALVASTPADKSIRMMLAIDTSTAVDFIRWNLMLHQTSDENSGTFDLNLVYGESQPNTLGFKKALLKVDKGKYTVSVQRIGDQLQKVYNLTGDVSHFRFVVLNENLFHILTSDDVLMLGNGGWSYTLNRKVPVKTDTSFRTPFNVPEMHVTEAVFDGRTPCEEISKIYGLKVPDDCFKIKWRLILYRHPETFQPAGYKLKQISNESDGWTEGKWIVRRDKDTGLCAYTLNPDRPEKGLSLFAAGENVLFFVDKQNQLLVGNADFSYTLNRMK